MMTAEHPAQRSFGGIGIALASVRIDHIMSEEFSRFVDDRDFATGTQTGVDAENGNGTGRGCKQ